MRRRLLPVALLSVALAAALASRPGAADARPRSAVVVVHDSVASVGGRVVLSGHVVADKGFAVTRPGEVTGRFATIRKVWKNLQLIRGRPFKAADVELTVGGKSYAAKTDRRGLFSMELDADGFEPGQHTIEARLKGSSDQRVLRGQLTLLRRGTRVLISDIDDTVLKTGVKHLATMLKHTLTTDAGEMQPYPEAAWSYRQIADADTAIVYVSTGPVTLYPKLRRFFEANGFPRGPLLLREPGLRNMLRSPNGYKAGRLRQLAAALPGSGLVLVGDSGEQDEEIYADARKSLPNPVDSTLIHNLGNETSARFPGETLFKRFGRAFVDLVLRAGHRGASTPSTSARDR